MPVPVSSSIPVPMPPTPAYLEKDEYITASQSNAFAHPQGPQDSPAQDMYFDDEGLGPLERIYLFSRSRAVFHRVFISRSLATFLPQVSPTEAVEYVLPLLNGLGTDQEDAVREAFVVELAPIIWWFFVNCEVVESEFDLDDQFHDGTQPKLLVQTFTPLLGSLLLSSNSVVGDHARWCIVNLLARLRDRNEGDVEDSRRSSSSSFGEQQYSLNASERQLIERELVEGIVIGMARLDFEEAPPADENWPPPIGSGTDAPKHPSSIQSEVSSTATSASISTLPSFASNSRYSDELSGPNSFDSSEILPDFISDIPVNNFASSMTDSGLGLDLSSASQTHSQRQDTPPNGYMNPQSTKSVPSPDNDFQSNTRTRDVNTVSWLETHRALDPNSRGTVHEQRHADGNTLDSTPLSTRRESFGDDLFDKDANTNEEAAVGRLASMSLIAAVTASGHLPESAKPLFVAEVSRVGSDPFYWVRREAAFALGALAKVVSRDVVVDALLPLYECFISDTTWHVRHSALFALPGLLSRLPPAQRRSFALSQFYSLKVDSSRSVRSGILEILGETIHTFMGDEGGPPPELIAMFTGSSPHKVPENRTSNTGASALPSARPPLQTETPPTGTLLSGAPLAEPERPLICAFNFPAVALTLGEARWPEIREYYLDLARDPLPKVRRTLAASLGEMARIIGSHHALNDLLPVLRSTLRVGDEVGKIKAVECLEILVGMIEEQHRSAIAFELDDLWTSSLRGWREREAFAKTFGGLSSLFRNSGDAVQSLVSKALTDDVSAVREEAISQVPRCLEGLGFNSAAARGLRDNIDLLLSSTSFRGRATYVSCIQSLVMSPRLGSSEIEKPSLWRSLEFLSKDPIIDVRIGVTRLVSLICYKYFSHQVYPQWIIPLIRVLKADPSEDIRSFVSFLQLPQAPPAFSVAPIVIAIPTSPSTHFATFSKPPYFPSESSRRQVVEEQDEEPETSPQTSFENVPPTDSEDVYVPTKLTSPEPVNESPPGIAFQVDTENMPPLVITQVPTRPTDRRRPPLSRAKTA